MLAMRVGSRIGEASGQESARWSHQSTHTADVDRGSLIERIARTWAGDAAAHARVLADQDPSWGTEVFDLADGCAVLCGPGLYVNRVLAMGLAGPVGTDDFDLLEQRSAVVGVSPSVDVVPTADRSVTELAGARGYAVVRFITTHVRLSATDPEGPGSDPSIVVQHVDAGLLGEWQKVAAEGFGAHDGDARRASDAFARASDAIANTQLLLARDRDDGHLLGCAGITIRDGLATLGGMTTLPAERGRGVQTALVAHRVRLAAESGCDLVTSSTIPANTSERNLSRAGFRPLYETVTLARPLPASGSS